MDVATVVAIALAVVVALSLLRLLLWQKASPSSRTRLIALLVAQPLIALLLYFALFPPRTSVRAGSDTLAVLAAGSSASDLAKAQDADVVALPEAPADLAAQRERAPDLATALRQHPQAARLRVLGTGLEARDLDAAASLPLQFDAPAAQAGLLELHYPQRLAPGQRFAVDGVAHAVAKIELRDPADKIAASAQPAADGRFHLEANVRSSGVAEFRLRLLDAGDKPIETATVPLQVLDAEPLRVAMLASAANAESKYLRRWLQDAGIDVQSRVQLGGGIAVGDAFALDAAGLQKFDLLVLDARSLASVNADALRNAVAQGLGLLVRLDDDIAPETRAQLRKLGFELDGAGNARTRLDAIDKQPSAQWRDFGRGRIGAWPVSESYPLALRGDAAYGALWSDAFATLARAGKQRFARIDGERVERRIALCDIDDKAQVNDARGATTALLPDPDAANCAAYWPRATGWHWLHDGERTQPFFVRADDDAPGLQRAARSATTLALVHDTTATAPSAGHAQAGPRGAAWPWWLAFVLCNAALWWFERRRR